MENRFGTNANSADPVQTPQNALAYSDLLPHISLLEVSHEVDISRAQSASDIFTDD